MMDSPHAKTITAKSREERAGSGPGRSNLVQSLTPFQNRPPRPAGP
ncbi:MAG: hypothetical protein ACE15F_12285 [bacterium]